MARRGKISEIWTDNATNFVGVSYELNKLYEFFKNNSNKQSLIDVTSFNKIKWHFIPPNSSHFGGLWETGIKSVKTLLKRALGNAFLNFKELYTFLVQVEAILNSRPLTPLSSDPSDLSVLTPSHFLIGDSLLSNPEPIILYVKTSRLSRWQHIEQMRQHFWTRWHNEYLNTLQKEPSGFQVK